MLILGISVLLSLLHDYRCGVLNIKEIIVNKLHLGGRSERKRFLPTMEVQNKNGDVKLFLLTGVFSNFTTKIN